MRYMMSPITLRAAWGLRASRYEKILSRSANARGVYRILMSDGVCQLPPRHRRARFTAIRLRHSLLEIRPLLVTQNVDAGAASFDFTGGFLEFGHILFRPSRFPSFQMTP